MCFCSLVFLQKCKHGVESHGLRCEECGVGVTKIRKEVIIRVFCAFSRRKHAVVGLLKTDTATATTAGVGTGAANIALASAGANVFNIFANTYAFIKGRPKFRRARSKSVPDESYYALPCCLSFLCCQKGMFFSKPSEKNQK